MLGGRRPGAVHRVCGEGERFAPAETWPEAPLRKQRRWPAPALVGAVVGIVAVLTIHGLHAPGAVVGGRGGAALAPAGAPAEQEAAVRAPAPRPRAIGRPEESAARVSPKRTRATRMRATRMRAIVAKPTAAAAGGVAVTATHDPAATRDRAPSGAGSEFGFER